MTQTKKFDGKHSNFTNCTLPKKKQMNVQSNCEKICKHARITKGGNIVTVMVTMCG